MPFQKGNKYGGKRPGAGPPTKEQADFKSRLLAELDKQVSAKVNEIVTKYQAMANEDHATMRHLIDRAVPPAKQELEISGGLKIVKVNAFEPDDGK